MSYKGQRVACLVIIWGIKKRAKEKRAEINLSGVEKTYFCLLFEKKHMKSGKTKITSYIPQRALGTFSLGFILQKESM